MKRLFLSLLLCTSLLTTPAYEAMGATLGTDNTEILGNSESLTDQSSVDEFPSDDSPSDESLSDQISSDESLSDHISSDESLPDPNPSDDSLSDESLADESLSNEKPGDDSLPDQNPPDESLSDLSLSDESLSDTLVGAAATPSPTPTTAATTYNSATPADGKTYVIRCVTNRNYCLDINGVSRSDKANIHIYKRSSVTSQLFTLKKQNDGSFVLYNFNSDMVVTAEGSSAVNQANVSQRPFTGSSLQKWQMEKCADGSYHIC
jgi:hypothetical protein